MNPQERQLVDDLFDRLSQLENAPRDRDASEAIQQGLKRAPNAVYALVQTVLLQDEALKRASARIEELEAQAQHAGEQPQQGGGFLDNMRGALFGQQPPSRGSVPSVRPGDAGRPVWNTQQQADPRMAGGYGAPPPGTGGPAPGPAAGGGGSFLGTAAAAAAGMVGGSLLMNSIGGLMGGSKHGFGDQSAMGKGEGKSESSNPWSSGDQSKDSLSRDAGLNDIGNNRNSESGGDSRQSFADHASYEDNDDDGDDDFDSDDSDSGDSDYA